MEGITYVPSDSNDEYSDTDKILLEDVRKWKNSDIEESEEEVYGLPCDDSSDGDGEKMSDSDIEGQDDDSNGLPDVRAWGQKRRNFYNTDYVDQDYGGFDEKDVEAAEREEEEARAIQKRLVEQLDEGDFLLDMFAKEPLQKDKEAEEEVIKTDLRKLSKRQKLVLLRKESPEFFGLVEDFKANMTELQQKIEPILNLIKSGKIPASQADSYVQTKYHLVLNYCTNIAFYLLLKTKRIAVQSHPIVHRLYQYRQLLKQLKPVDEVMTPQLESILELVHNGDEITPVTSEKTNHLGKTKAPKKKLLKFLSHLKEEANSNDSLIKLPAKDAFAEKNGNAGLNSDISGGSDSEETKDVDEEMKEDGKRGITYQIAKNKGLTPHRKKEQRNPRVKHRNKFRKAKIRRKGQVREPRKEVEKYGGEISGIKIGVVKSIKLK
ncbi:something about silencing protein 10 [Zootermopsis nevadensis]|uniref:Something about silencing protein 10 n=1 Tax=Zootermopsis nevadensis TaxID=136037 RepID=A0A067QV45_ZOONE|nr:something about silencing protein 10 [Zootermopsis nevadensis]KDR14064.1 Something about silencing protein 10 [Zootermopsis nevadensis]